MFAATPRVGLAQSVSVPGNAANQAALVTQTASAVNALAQQGSATSAAVSAIQANGAPCSAGQAVMHIAVRSGGMVSTVTHCAPNAQAGESQLRALARFYAGLEGLPARVFRLADVQHILLDCRDYATCREAAADLRQRIEASEATGREGLAYAVRLGEAYNLLVERLGQLQNWTAEQIAGVRADLTALTTRVAGLEGWRDGTVTPTLARHDRELDEVRTRVGRLEHRWLTLVGFAAGTYLSAGPISWTGVEVGLRFDARVVEHFVARAEVSAGYGTIPRWDEFSPLVSIAAGLGYERDSFRIFGLGSYVVLPSDIRNIHADMFGGVGGRIEAEYDATRAIAIGARVGIYPRATVADPQNRRLTTTDAVELALYGAIRWNAL